MKKLHIAIASTTSKPGAVADNLRQIAKFAEQAGRDDADLLLTPEMSASGYGPYPEVLETAEIAGKGPIYEYLAKSAGKIGVVICAGFVEENEKKRYLSHYVVYPDGRFIVQRKNRVMLTERPLDPSGDLIPVDPSKPSDDPADPGQPISPQFTFFEVKGIRCAIVICADSGIVGLDDLLASQNVNLVLLATGGGGVRKDRVTTVDLHSEDGRRKYLKILETVFFPGEAVLKCIKYRRAFAAVNICGFDGVRHYHVGHGTIINPMGEVPAMFHGLPNLDRQRPMFTHAVVDVDEHI